jgi:drug/metabolite transporter (DMT)-like permease
VLRSTQGPASQHGARPLLLLVASAVIYGALFSLNKIAADAGVPPIPYVFWQCVIAGIVLWIVSLATGAPPGWQPLHMLFYLLVGGGGIGIPTALLTHVAPHLPVGLVTMVLVFSPLITYLLGLLVRLERFRWLGVIGILFGFAGVALIAAPSAALPSRDMAGWFLLSLTAPLLFASANICAALLAPRAGGSAGTAAGILLGSALVLAATMLVTHQSYWFSSIPNAGDGAILAGAAINGAFVVMFLEIVRMAGPVFFSQFNYLAVVAGIGWSFMLFGERLGIYIWAALALMFVGLLLTTMRDRNLRLLMPGSDPGQQTR